LKPSRPDQRHPVKAGAFRAPASRLSALTGCRRPGEGLAKPVSSNGNMMFHLARQVSCFRPLVAHAIAASTVQRLCDQARSEIGVLYRRNIFKKPVRPFLSCTPMSFACLACRTPPYPTASVDSEFGRTQSSRPGLRRNGASMRQGRQKEHGTIQAAGILSTVDSVAIPFAQRLSCTIAEACEVTGLGRTKLYELIGDGYLATTTVGRRRLVLVRSLLSLVNIHSPDVDGA
jgi:excisionase family DNA binding protein